MTDFNRIEVIHDTGGISLNLFLLTRMQPWRWDIMLASGGIRAEHAGKTISNLTPETTLSQGDVVFIDEAYGRTWMELRRKASTDFRDYVFCPQRHPDGQKPDRFLTNEITALLDDGTAKDIEPKKAAFLTDLIPELTPLARYPIRHLILVSHANPFANIDLPVKNVKLDPDQPDRGFLNWETLNECIADGSLRIEGKGLNPIVLPRPENENGQRVPCAVIIRGCSSGIHEPLLRKIQEAFGPQVDEVIMPKHFDAAEYTTGSTKPALLEYFTHRFIVTSKTPLNRQGVVEAFKAAKLVDWQDNRVPDSYWDGLVPPDVSHFQMTKALPMRIEGRSATSTFRARFQPEKLVSIAQVMEQKKKPTAEEIKEFIVARWKRLPSFRDPEWPFWKRMGFGIKSDDDFFAFWDYVLSPGENKAAKPGQWAVRAMRFSFEIRTPLADNGTMICKYIPNGESGTPSNNIDYNDQRIFGRYKSIPKHYAQQL